MKLPTNIVIPRDKLLRYLLLPRDENDKSGFLALGGYSLRNWQQLKEDLIHFARQNPIDSSVTTSFGEKHSVKGTLTDPNGYELYIVTIWLTLESTNETRFITLFPDREYQEGSIDKWK